MPMFVIPRSHAETSWFGSDAKHTSHSIFGMGYRHLVIAYIERPIDSNVGDEIHCSARTPSDHRPIVHSRRMKVSVAAADCAVAYFRQLSTVCSIFDPTKPL